VWEIVMARLGYMCCVHTCAWLIDSH